MEIKFITGDATQPVGDGPKIIVHVCNDIGAWGAGFVLAVSKRWPEPEQRYRSRYGKDAQPFKLGDVQLVQVGRDLWVANLIGQTDVKALWGVPPVRYQAIRAGLQILANAARGLGASIHMPRIGCGLAGGKWEEVGKIVKEELSDGGVSVTVYDLAQKIMPITKRQLIAMLEASEAPDDSILNISLNREDILLVDKADVIYNPEIKEFCLDFSTQGDA
jgi:O-acetyl-ADP-ribose deacetylase (regulator of RNase III)